MRTRFGEELRRRREALGLSQEKFGERLGISRVAISELESGKNGPSDETLGALESEFGLDRQTSHELLGRVPETGQKSSMALLEEISNIPDEDTRLRRWMSLPASTRRAALKLSEDMQRATLRRLEELNEQTTD